MGPDRIHYGDLYADIIPDRLDTGLWFYVIQREHTPEILGMGVTISQTTARQAADKSMRLLPSHSSVAA